MLSGTWKHEDKMDPRVTETSGPYVRPHVASLTCSTWPAQALTSHTADKYTFELAPGFGHSDTAE